MQIAFLPNTLAPLATGHPLSLPALQRGAAPQKRVLPVDPALGSGTTQTGARPRDQELPLPGQDDPERTAPPSMMQMRISQILDEQAREPEQPAEPETVGRSETTGPEHAELKTDPDPADTTEETKQPEHRAPVETPLRAYEEAASFSRNADFNTLP